MAAKCRTMPRNVANIRSIRSMGRKKRFTYEDVQAKASVDVRERTPSARVDVAKKKEKK